MNGPRIKSLRRRGAAVTELAICLPILVIFVFGTIEICNYIYKKQSISIAAYEGARIALVSGSTEEKVRLQCELLLADRRINDAVIQISPADFETAPTGTFIAVEVSAPLASNGVLPKQLFAQDFLNARVEMMKEFETE